MKILVVDDEPVVLCTVAALLRSLRYEVVTAVSGEEALKACQEKDSDIGLLLTDVNMPRMNGVELARCLTGAHRIPVVFMSGYSAATPQMQELLRGGGFTETALLAKPFTTAELKRAMEKAILTSR